MCKIFLLFMFLTLRWYQAEKNSKPKIKFMYSNCLSIYRYSDIIVHRLLAVCIGADASYPELTDKYKTQVSTQDSMSKNRWHKFLLM